MHLKNYMEDAVDQMMDKVLKDLDVCKCDRCRMDIKALALNNLPPKYVVSEEGELYVKTNELVRQFEVDIIKAITMAAIKVNNNKRH
ncbi:competence protein ComFB [Thermoanaerobacter thermohydrosulfuricus]|jgi:competence protein ComFB|uniref:Competence protein ComFB n=4 Tax=Thermoanaerobacter TaxID=1754 RepID=A0A1M4V9P2_9THEO|nr:MULTISPECIES: late competence development ComFB family protein [Thermoanaerobacter]EGD52260.1 Late competence development protein ComFB [Thermoanaerobacter ethanolicus JW 200]KUJ91259.1 MAG: Late competence development protein ComFB [Thermoanaerobacter thermocopriae]MDK2814451.1 competence protein ComFB [Thermoanaerobacter sp.]AEM78643.1 Late competence development protein ComFB [Thermoanaerobacter wiegelii Rt8.B1]EMT40204.1 Late competence development protein ComFB [Thermoanaerobacter ther